MVQRVISADNHILEPRDLWTSRLPASLRERAPRVASHPDGGDGWSFHGEVPRRPFGLEAVAGRKLSDITDRGGLRWEEIMPGNYDPAEHLVDMDRDGIDAVVVYPAVAMAAWVEPDRELGVALLRAYNDWMLDDFQAHDPARIVGLPLLPIDDDLDTALGELDRCSAKGARAMLIPGSPERPYNDPEYDPIWAAAADAGVVLTFHRNHGGRSKDTFYDELAARQEISVAGITTRFFSAVSPLTYMIFSGVFERHPRLRIVAAEVNCGWLPFLAQTMDQQYGLQDTWAGLPIQRAPSEYLGENVFVTILDDHVGFKLMRDDERLCAASMYSTDYPHSVTLWPDSAKWTVELTEGLSATQRERVLSGNAARLYGLSPGGAR